MYNLVQPDPDLNETERRYSRTMEEAFPATHTRATSGPVHKRAPFLRTVLRACYFGFLFGLVVAIVATALKGVT